MANTTVNLILTLIFATLLLGCDSQNLSAAQGRQSTAESDDAMVAQASAADAEWSQLISLSEFEIESGGDLVEFMIGIETQRLEFRRLGLEFWAKHPEDSRRYSWLLITVGIPPVYAENIEDWAVKETELAPNSAAVDQPSIDSWEQVCRFNYPIWTGMFSILTV